MYATVPAPLPGCQRTTDGRVSCPPRMSDGRAFTDYRTRCATMEASLAGTYGNEQARQWIANSGENLMAVARQLSLHKNSCGECTTATMKNGDVVPEAQVQVCTADSCGVSTVSLPGAIKGLGQGRRYTTDRTDTTGAYIGRIPGHSDHTFRSRGVQGLSATCATDEDRDVAWAGFAAAVPKVDSMTGRR